MSFKPQPMYENDTGLLHPTLICSGWFLEAEFKVTGARLGEFGREHPNASKYIFLWGRRHEQPQLKGGQDAHPTRTLFLQKWDVPVWSGCKPWGQVR